MPFDRMVEKARRLVKSRRVERLDNDRFLVIGDHGTYTVARTPDDGLTCNCQGFSIKGKCSHVAAVVMLTEFTKNSRLTYRDRPRER